MLSPAGDREPGPFRILLRTRWGFSQADIVVLAREVARRGLIMEPGKLAVNVRTRGHDSRRSAPPLDTPSLTSYCCICSI